MSELEKFTDKELLRELITRNGYQKAPDSRKLHGNWYSSLHEINCDETAEIIFHEDAFIDMCLR